LQGEMTAFYDNVNETAIGTGRVMTPKQGL
jgi:hypothetical protein